MDILLKLIVNFEKVAREVVEQGGDVSFEWPTGCALWKHELTQNLINGLSMNKVNMHGCAAGLRSSKDDVPIKKPLTVASTSPAIIDAEQVSVPGKRATSCSLPVRRRRDQADGAVHPGHGRRDPLSYPGGGTESARNCRHGIGPEGQGRM